LRSYESAGVIVANSASSKLTVNDFQPSPVV